MATVKLGGVDYEFDVPFKLDIYEEGGDHLDKVLELSKKVSAIIGRDAERTKRNEERIRKASAEPAEELEGFTMGVLTQIIGASVRGIYPALRRKRPDLQLPALIASVDVNASTAMELANAVMAALKQSEPVVQGEAEPAARPATRGPSARKSAA
jgi:hypothetical protein